MCHFISNASHESFKHLKRTGQEERHLCRLGNVFLRKLTRGVNRTNSNIKLILWEETSADLMGQSRKPV